MASAQVLHLSQFPAVQSLTWQFRRNFCEFSRHAVPVRQQKLAKRLSRSAVRASASAASGTSTTASTVVKEVPGSWDAPGFESDYNDYYFKQGWYEFYVSRQKQHGNVFKANVGPTAEQAQFTIILDQAAYQILYDNSKVDKANLFFGKYMPDQAKFTNGQRPCAYLDPSEELHSRIKSYTLALLAKYGPRHVGACEEVINELFKEWEAAIADKGQVEVAGPTLQFMWDWHMKAFGAPPFKEGSKHANDWASASLLPIVSLPDPQFLEKVLKKVLPFVQKPKEDFEFLMKNFETKLPEAVSIGTSPPISLSREQALTNLVFFIAFNSRNALASSFCNALVEFALLDKTTKAEMVAEVAAALKKSSGAVTFQAVQDMPILESFVYEVFRCHPPVTVQHAMLKEDTVIQSNSGLYQLRAGDKLLGHCGFASRDPAVFDKPDTFIAKRFMGEGKAKIKNILWSNGYQDVPHEETLNTKQCPGKDFVPLMVRVFMAHFLRKYKDVELTGKVGWSKTKIVPGPMLESYKLSGPELLVKSLTKV
eukprot:TRINITY_DN22902_c0_g1_i1.p1 TRINITY_DN22902_c0_g1~~TRINITY_DN22902_c0_g1_i1.p1  ORF type:complete len:574 (-),score=108.78 TRINITY_DN22902_c0_g1_i1:409-2022(-)